MKDRLSFTLDQESVAILDALSKNIKFRNRSHIVEIALRVLEASEKEGKKEGKKK